MKLENTVKGKLLKRYKRFFSDVLLDTGEIIIAHTPNTGPMTSCWEKNMSCILTQNNDPKRKLKYTLELTHNNKSFIIVNTHLPNKLIKEALDKNQIERFKSFTKITPEFKIGKSRFDFLLEKEGEKYLLEIKNVSTIDQNKCAIFPDTRSERALKHIKELTELKSKGYNCGVLFLIGREDCDSFRPAGEIMPDYLAACQVAYSKGVELIPLQFKVNPELITVDKEINIIL